MKEEQAAPEKIIVIDIKLTRGLAVVLSCVLVLALLLTYLTLTGDNASASDVEAAPAASTGMRQFYLTSATVDGFDALTACATGYHMASLWEILDPSNLAYNTALGHTSLDSGQGPPSDYLGWVRTGSYSSPADIVGAGNCIAWTSRVTGQHGSMVRLSWQWAADNEDIGVWLAATGDCHNVYRVWCIED